MYLTLFYPTHIYFFSSVSYRPPLRFPPTTVAHRPRFWLCAVEQSISSADATARTHAVDIWYLNADGWRLWPRCRRKRRGRTPYSPVEKSRRKLLSAYLASEVRRRRTISDAAADQTVAAGPPATTYNAAYYNSVRRRLCVCVRWCLFYHNAPPRTTSQGLCAVADAAQDLRTLAAPLCSSPPPDHRSFFTVLAVEYNASCIYTCTRILFEYRTTIRSQAALFFRTLSFGVKHPFQLSIFVWSRTRRPS